MNARHALLKAALLAIVAPSLGCGGETTETDTSQTASAGGGSQGGAGGSSSGQGGSGGSSGNQGGSSGAAGAGASAGTGGQGGSSTAGGSGGSGGTSAQGGSAGTSAQGGAAGTSAQGGAAGEAGSGQGGAAGGAAGAAGKFPCVDPKPVLVGGKPTGVEQCASGLLRRHEAIECPSLLPRATTCESTGTGSECSKDTDCAAMPHGHCDHPQVFGGDASYCGCSYGCVSDAECGAGMLCLCGDPVGRCVPTACASDAECGGGSCLSWDQTGGCGETAFACQTPQDQCAADSDCTPSGDRCMVQNGARACVPGGCAIGRPLVVDDRVLTARLALRSDWA